MVQFPSPTSTVTLSHVFSVAEAMACTEMMGGVKSKVKRPSAEDGRCEALRKALRFGCSRLGGGWDENSTCFALHGRDDDLPIDRINHITKRYSTKKSMEF